MQDHTIPILNHEGKVAQLYGMVSDITPQKEFEEKMTYLAYHDFLTHLPNARSFEQRLSTIAEEFKRTGERFAVLSIDLDRVKQINDSLGHAIGDQLIKSMSKRMLSLLSDQHFLARISGDEYAILFTNYESPEVIAHFAKSLLNKINEPFKIDSYELFLTASIGISIFPNDSNDFKKVLTNAHAALNRAKELGKDNYQFYSPTHDILAYKAFLLEKDLRHALTSNQFELYYQPRIDLKSKKIISAEALIRWKHPDLGLVSPGEFISLAEESGFIIEIGKWVILHVCEQIKKWQQELKPVVPISINLSSKSLQKYNWKTSLSHILNQTNVDPTLLEFEITENTILHKEEVIEKAIGYIKDLGVKLSLDDFGTGYASITNLKHYQFDFIKIDRSFIQNITENSQDGLIVKSMIRLSHDLKMKVVAEGVETLEQLKLLQSYGCDEVQGYLFSKPVELEKFEKLLTSMIILPETPRCSKEMKERRKSHRIELPFPISSDMTIAQIKGQPLSLGVSEIIIDNIGRGGIHFLSHIKLPVHSEVILQITIELFDKKIQLQGHVVWQNEMKDQVFEYGLKYTMIDENQLLPLLEQLKKELHKTPKFQSHHLITEDKIQYIEKLRINN